MKTVTAVAGDGLAHVAEGARRATEGIRNLTHVAAVHESKHRGGHAGEKRRHKKRTRAKNRVARASRKASR